MTNRLKITFRKRSQAGNLIWLVIMLPFLFAFFVEWLGVPHMLRYSVDVAWVLLFFYVLLAQKRANKERMGALPWIAGVFFVYTAVVYLVQYQSLFYYLWGVRNNFRGYVAFFAFVVFLKKEDIEYYYKMFDVLFWINVAVSLVQFFYLGLTQDFLGGIFGAEKGSNGFSIVFFTIMLTRSILLYLDKKESLFAFLIKSVAALLVAALAEIKFFFFLFIIIVLLAMLFTKFTWRKVWTIVGGLAAVMGFALLLESLFGFEGFLSWDFLLDYTTSDEGYTGRGDINRLNAISIINDQWLKNGWLQLFGLGLGNCDSAGFEFLTTPFFESYGDMHYTWFYHAFLYLETGWIGLILYYGFFVYIFFAVLKIEKRSGSDVKNACRLARILTICSVILSIYNISMRMESVYMMFFALAVPFVLEREQRKKAYLCDKKMVSKNPAQ